MHFGFKYISFSVGLIIKNVFKIFFLKKRKVIKLNKKSIVGAGAIAYHKAFALHATDQSSILSSVPHMIP